VPPGAADFEAVTGGGVTASVDGRAVLVGKPSFLEGRGVPVGLAEDALAREESEGRTVVLVAIDGELAGLIAIADAPKSDARGTVERMRGLGLLPVMLTGDAERTALSVAHQIGIDDVRARVLPEEKAARVRELQAVGRRVAFVGDGINDAPALMQADVGIAIGAGTDIAIKSSDVILIGERLSGVLDAYEIGGRSYRKTVQNLWLAFFFNGVGVPLATTGLVHPVWAMIAMAASVTAVLLNSFGGKLVPPGPHMAEVAGERWPAKLEAAAEVATPGGVAPGEAKRLLLYVPDMHCAGCANTIRMVLSAREGVNEVDADANRKCVRVEFRPDVIGVTEIQEEVTSGGFQVQSAHLEERRS